MARHKEQESKKEHKEEKQGRERKIQEKEQKQEKRQDSGHDRPETAREGKQKREGQKIAELTETLQRLQAEFENFRKRTEKETAEVCRYANIETIKKILPIVDSFELALKNTKDKEEFIKGIELVHKQLMDLLKSEDVRPIDALGKRFDPKLHEAMVSEKSDKVDIVLEELQKGYMIKDKVLRHSLVKVGKE